MRPVLEANMFHWNKFCSVNRMNAELKSGPKDFTKGLKLVSETCVSTNIQSNIKTPAL